MAGESTEREDAVQAGRRLGVLLVRFQADQDSPRLGHGGRLVERVAHQHVIVLDRRPGLLGALVGVDHRCAALGGETDRLFQVLGADVGPAEHGMAGKRRQLNARSFTRAPNPIRIVEHRDAMEVAALAQQLAARVDHRLDVLVAQFGRFFDAPLERFVVVADELHVDAQRDFTHD